MSDAITPWIHILAVTVWLGPQFFLFIAAIPAIRLIDDRELRLRVMRVITTRFGWLAWGAMLIIVMTGISNLFQVGADVASPDISSTDYRYFHIFSLKMVLVGLTVALTALHTFVVGPRLLQAQEAPADEERTAGLRRTSMIISGLALLLSIAVVYVAALLANHDYSFQPT